MDVSTEKPLNESKPHNSEPITSVQNVILEEKIHLTTKRFVEFLISGTLRDKVCRSCLKVCPLLTSLAQELEVANDGTLYKVSVRDMIQSFYPYVITEDSELPNKICNNCLDRTINLYLFNLQYKQSEQALRRCLNEVYDSVTLLDPLVRPKLGRQKIHINHNVVNVTYNYVKYYAQPLIQLNKKGELLDETTKALNKYECPKCWEVLPSLSSFLNHGKTHPKDMWLKCRFCGLSFSGKVVYRRHIRDHENDVIQKKTTTDALTNKTETVKVDDKFECKTCATVSHNYITHLQHMETHKFKMVLDNLLNKSAEDLCTVCLDSKKDMVSIDKTVALHGGCEELMGDRSVDNILAASFPDQPSKHYKYQELFIPSPAKIIKITPRKNRKVNKIINRHKKHIEKFKFTEPEIITDIQFTDNLPVVFKFQTPVDALKYADTISHQEKNNDLNLKSVDCKKPKQVEIVEDIVSLDYEIKTVHMGNEIKACKYCWLFAKTAKCDLCKKTNDTADDENPPEDNLFHLDKQQIKETRIINVYPKTQIEEKKWQCYVCLTSNNAESKLCYCCEAQNNSGEAQKKTRVFLKRQNTEIFKDDESHKQKPNNKDILHDLRNAKKIIKDHNIISTETEILQNNNEKIEKNHYESNNINAHIMSNLVTKVVPEDNNIIYFKALSQDIDTSETMEICEEETENHKINSIHYLDKDITEVFQAIEEMSVDQNDLKEHNDNITVHDNIINVAQNIQAFQFIIGASSSNERRIKKPIRRVTSHK